MDSLLNRVLNGRWQDIKRRLAPCWNGVMLWMIHEFSSSVLSAVGFVNTLPGLDAMEVGLAKQRLKGLLNFRGFYWLKSKDHRSRLCNVMEGQKHASYNYTLVSPVITLHSIIVIKLHELDPVLKRKDILV